MLESCGGVKREPPDRKEVLGMAGQMKRDAECKPGPFLCHLTQFLLSSCLVPSVGLG